MAAPMVIVFDLGGVLIDWDPRHLYRKVFADGAEMERFLATVCTPAWNEGFDRGMPFREGVERLMRQHPELAEPIRAYRERWAEMLAGTIPGAVELVAELRDAGLRLFGLSNWSAETFPLARERFAFLSWFEGILISGEVGATKPSPRLYLAFLDRFGLAAGACVFVDDRLENVEAARALGFTGVRFGSVERLRGQLRDLGVLDGGPRRGR